MGVKQIFSCLTPISVTIHNNFYPDKQFFRLQANIRCNLVSVTIEFYQQTGRWSGITAPQTCRLEANFEQFQRWLLLDPSPALLLDPSPALLLDPSPTLSPDLPGVPNQSEFSPYWRADADPFPSSRTPVVAGHPT